MPNVHELIRDHVTLSIRCLDRLYAHFDVQDPEWGPAFLKSGTYLPYPIKLCLNGHEWVKQQLRVTACRLRVSTTGFSAVLTRHGCKPPAIA